MNWDELGLKGWDEQEKIDDRVNANAALAEVIRGLAAQEQPDEMGPGYGQQAMTALEGAPVQNLPTANVGNMLTGILNENSRRRQFKDSQTQRATTARSCLNNVPNIPGNYRPRRPRTRWPRLRPGKPSCGR